MWLWIENLALAAVGVITRLAFFVYRAFVLVVGLGLLLGWLVYLLSRIPVVGQYVWIPVVIGLVVLLLITAKRARKDNPYRQYVGLRGWLDKRIDAFIAWIGTLKYFSSPISVVEDPGSYKIKGGEIRELIDGALQPGDILLRGYDGYVDGEMIRMTGDASGLGSYFSHAAFYLGEATDADRATVARRLKVQQDNGEWRDATDAEKEAVRTNPNYFHPGRQLVVHAMTKGVFVEDILTFSRCDYLIALRVHDAMQLEAAERQADKSLISDLAPDAEAIHAKLMRGEAVAKAEVIQAARLSALGKIGSCYDFQFNDIKTAHRFSCSEFVYYCYKSIHCYIGLNPKLRGFLKIFFRRETITPSDIYEAAVTQKKLEVVWMSAALKAKA